MFMNTYNYNEYKLYAFNTYNGEGTQCSIRNAKNTRVLQNRLTPSGHAGLNGRMTPGRR